uniref:GAG-pre-integrase domain-containing protein n=1 Tax=Tanacetum cinerariifolium TaxID=118510 RepID=A0A6L2K743_TANCI|nr:hypothetical protein [Tanacetum cinerariifolium]
MAAVEVQQTLEYRGGQLNVAPVLEVENFTNWKERFICHIIGIEPQFEKIIKNSPFISMTAGQRKQENQWTGDERKAANLDQRLKSLIMSILPDDQMNTVINCLTATSTWDDLILYHEGPSDVKESKVMDLKLCYNTFKFKEGESLTQTFIKYKALINDLVNDGIKLSKLEINTGFIKGLPKKWLSFCQSLKNTNNVKDSELASLLAPLSTAFFFSSIVQDFQDSPDDEEDTRSSHEYLNDLEEEYQARALLEKSKIFFKKASMVKNKGLIAEAYEWDEEVSSDDNEMVEVKVIMALAEENDRILGVDQLTEDPSSSGLKDIVFVKSSVDDTKILPSESQRNTTDSSVTVTDSSATDYDSADESSVCSIHLPPLKKLDDAGPISGPKTIKSILRLKSTFKAEALKDVTINKPSSAHAKGNKISSALKVHSPPASKLKSVKIKDDPPLAIHLKSLGRMSSRPNIPRPLKRLFPPCIHCGGIDHLSNECLYYPICKLCGSYDHDTNGHNRVISLERKINPRNPQHAFKKCKACGSLNHTTTDHYDIEWFKRGKALQTKKAEALKSTRAESSNANRSKTPTKRGTIFKSNKEIIMIAPRVTDVYVLDMTSFAQESCFFAKASENLNWLWHKRLAHLNFKTINKLAKQNLVIGLPSLVYLKDKPCSSCEKEKHHRASFKTKQTSSIKKCLHLLHMDLSGLVTPRSINYEKYTLVIVDEYSRNSTLINFCYEKGISQNFYSLYTPEQNEDTSVQNTTIPSPPSVPSMVTPTPQDRWSQDKYIELVNIIGNPGAGMLTRSIAKQLSAALAHESHISTTTATLTPPPTSPPQPAPHHHATAPTSSPPSPSLSHYLVIITTPSPPPPWSPSPPHLRCLLATHHHKGACGLIKHHKGAFGKKSHHKGVFVYVVSQLAP